MRRPTLVVGCPSRPSGDSAPASHRIALSHIPQNRETELFVNQTRRLAFCTVCSQGQECSHGSQYWEVRSMQERDASLFFASAR